jgi:hypothetical protein
MTASFRRRAFALACAVVPLIVAGALFIPAAQAHLPSTGTFSITPSERDLVGRPPVALTPTRVTNTTQSSYQVVVFPVMLTQNLSGAFQFADTRGSLDAARTILSASPSRFRLAPGQSRTVALRWRTLPRDTRAAYIGLIFQGQAQLTGGRSVPVISRLLSVNFFRRPGHYRSTGKFAGLHAIQVGPRVLSFIPRVKNTGTIVASPQHGRLTIADSSGRTVYSTSWPGQVILPGAERDFDIDVHSVLPAGTYRAHATMSFGTVHHADIATTFTLAGPNELSAPAVKISAFAAHGDVGQPAHITGRVQSTGTAPATVKVALSLFRVTGGLPGTNALASTTLHFAGMAPGTTRSFSVNLAKPLRSGEYEAVAQYVDSTGATTQLTSDFAAIHPRSAFYRIQRFIDQHLVLIILVIALIAFTLLITLLLRRQRHLELELRTAKAERQLISDAERDLDTTPDPPVVV